MKTIGVLALQGAVSEHLSQIEGLGHKAVPITLPAQLATIDGLILPGGESTAMHILLGTFDFIPALITFIEEGHGVFGTCAGMVLLSQLNEGAFLEAEVVRNGFGRQIDSFEYHLPVELETGTISFPTVFIRAPFYASVGNAVKVLARIDTKIVAVETPTLLATAFHPELTEDKRLLAYFIDKKVTASQS